MPTYRDKTDGSYFEAASDAAAEVLWKQREKARKEDQIELPPMVTERDLARERGKQASPAHSLLLGFGAGVTRQWQDEAAALGAASGLPVGTPPLLSAPVGGVRMLARDPEAMEAYNRQVDQFRGFEEGSGQANPYSALGGELIGGMAGPAPGSGIVSMAGRGAAEGLLGGAGAGEGAEGKAIGAGIGGAIGGAVGGGIPALWELAQSGVRGALGLATPTLASRGAAEGTRQVQGAVQSDLAAQNDPLVRDYLQNFAEGSGQAPRQMIGDAGSAAGELARAAGNLNPDADRQIRNAVQGRYRAQQGDFEEWWGRPNTLEARDALDARARAENRPRYDRAYSEGASVWDRRLQELSAAPDVQDAIRKAARSSANEAAQRGTPMVRNPFQEGPDGVLTLPPGQSPSLEFWDHVQRELRKKMEAAPRGGQEARELTNLRRTMLEELDSRVPSFREARQGAAAAFGQEDALEAGKTFLSRPGLANEEKRALERMTPAERDLFRLGMEEDVIGRVRNRAENRNIADVINTPEMQERIRLGLGPQRGQDFTNYMTIATTMDRLRGAMGNSTTVRQNEARKMVEQGVMTAGAAGGGAGFGTENEILGAGSLGAAVVAALSVGNRQMTQAATRRIAQLITSNDPADMELVLRTARTNPAVGRAIRDGFKRLQNTLIQQGAAFAGEEFD